MARCPGTYPLLPTRQWKLPKRSLRTPPATPRAPGRGPITVPPGPRHGPRARARRPGQGRPPCPACSWVIPRLLRVAIASPPPRPPTTSRINYNPGSPELPHQALTSEPAARVGRDHDHAHGRYRNCNTRACACPSTGRASGRKCVYVRVYAWTWACWIH